MTGARLYFTAFDPNGNANLWVTDGTSTGTRQVSAAGGSRGIDPSWFAVLGNSGYFQGDDA